MQSEDGIQAFSTKKGPYLVSADVLANYRSKTGTINNDRSYLPDFIARERFDPARAEVE